MRDRSQKGIIIKILQSAVLQRSTSVNRKRRNSRAVKLPLITAEGLIQSSTRRETPTRSLTRSLNERDDQANDSPFPSASRADCNTIIAKICKTLLRRVAAPRATLTDLSLSSPLSKCDQFFCMLNDTVRPWQLCLISERREDVTRHCYTRGLLAYLNAPLMHRDRSLSARVDQSPGINARVVETRFRLDRSRSRIVARCKQMCHSPSTCRMRSDIEEGLARRHRSRSTAFLRKKPLSLSLSLSLSLAGDSRRTQKRTSASRFRRASCRRDLFAALLGAKVVRGMIATIANRVRWIAEIYASRNAVMIPRRVGNVKQRK